MMRTGLFVGAAGALLLASTAMAEPFTFPGGTEIKLKLTDGANLYNGSTPLPRADAFAGYPFDGTETAALKSLIEGSRDFTAFTITSYSVGANPALIPITGGHNLVGIATFLKVKELSTVNFAPGLISLDLENDSRGDTKAPDGYVGRFFLFDLEGAANAGTFNTSGGLPGDVNWFDSTTNATRVSSNGVDFFDIDILNNFTGALTAGADNVTNSLLLTGNFKLDENGQFIDLLTNSALPGVSFSGLISDSILRVDGGHWFDIGSVTTDASFKINQTGYTEPWNGLSGSASNYPNVGDLGVFEGGWQIASEDPIQFRTNGVIPEPATAGLAILGLAAATGLLARRRSR